MIHIESTTKAPVLESARLMCQLHALFALGKDEGEEPDAIRDQMESPWYAMTEQEQERIGGLSEDLYALAEGGPPRVATNEQEFQAWQQQAKIALEQFERGDVDATLAFLRGPLPATAPVEYVRHLQGQCWVKLGDAETAAVFEKAAEEADPTHASAALSLPALKERLTVSPFSLVPGGSNQE